VIDKTLTESAHYRVFAMHRVAHKAAADNNTLHTSDTGNEIYGFAA
jgi:hypothetical protein